MSIFSKLQDPDNVGSSEYRAIYDCIGDAEGTDEERDEMIVAMLQQFAEHSLAMLKVVGHPVQLKVISSDGDAAINVDGIDTFNQLVNIIHVDADAEDQHVLTYKGVSVYQTVKDFREGQLSDCWLSTMSNTDWESEHAFDVRDLDGPPEGYSPEGVDQDDGDHLALAWAIDIGNLHDEGYDRRWRLVEPNEALEKGDQRLIGDKRTGSVPLWEETPVLTVGEKAGMVFTYRRKIKQ